MPASKATTVDDYLKELPAERRAAINAVRKAVLKNLPRGFEEGMSSGMISYHVPLKRFPDTYNKQPLMYAALAAQKNYCALYMMCAYMNPKGLKRIQDAFKKHGKKLDMGKSCIRFQSADDLPLQELGEIIGSITPEDWMALYEKSRKK